MCLPITKSHIFKITIQINMFCRKAIFCIKTLSKIVRRSWNFLCWSTYEEMHFYFTTNIWCAIHSYTYGPNVISSMAYSFPFFSSFHLSTPIFLESHYLNRTVKYFQMILRSPLILLQICWSIGLLFNISIYLKSIFWPLLFSTQYTNIILKTFNTFEDTWRVWA